MIAGEDQDSGPRFGQFKDRLDQRLNDLSRKVVFIEKVPAVN